METASHKNRQLLNRTKTSKNLKIGLESNCERYLGFSQNSSEALPILHLTIRKFTCGTHCQSNHRAEDGIVVESSHDLSLLHRTDLWTRLLPDAGRTVCLLQNERTIIYWVLSNGSALWGVPESHSRQEDKGLGCSLAIASRGAVAQKLSMLWSRYPIKKCLELLQRCYQCSWQRYFFGAVIT